ncbi:MAG: long-chain fatty acid--CoA ligase [Chitinophagales bacterium]|nr:long-chain fatty acid--CoA ligase [Chitinophagales bacterium]
MDIHSNIFYHSESEIVYKEETIASRRLVNMSEDIAKRFISVGIDATKIVGYQADQNPLCFLVAELISSIIGCTRMPCSFQQIKDDIRKIIENVPIQYLIIESKILKKWLIKNDFAELVFDFKILSNTMYLLQVKNLVLEENIPINQTILMSSGTIGEKKFILQSSDNFLNSVQTFSSTDIFDNKRRYLNLLPLYFSGGRKVFYSSLLRGLDIIFPDNNNFHEIDIEYDLTSGTPFLLNFLISIKNSIHTIDFICGGASLPKALYEKADSKNIHILNVYGLTETSSIATYNTPKINRRFSIGQLSKINDYKIVDKVLYIRGVTVCKYKLIHNHLIQITDENNWLNTHDKVKVDDDGFVFYMGRTQNNYKLGDGLFTDDYHIAEILEYYLKDYLFGIKHIVDDFFELNIVMKEGENETEIKAVVSEINRREIFKIKTIHLLKLNHKLESFRKEIPLNSYEIINNIHILPNDVGETNKINS